MRPVQLEIEGFTSFAERTVVEVSDLQLFAITGSTGAGKSSLLDAMLLALFGRVPRVGKQHRQLITDGADRVSVRFDFEAGRESYRIARCIRLKGAMELRLERAADGGFEPLADRSADIDREIERILGIDYSAFTRAVVLPQGKFDAFLKGDPSERRDLLTHLLDFGIYKRMAELTSQRYRDQDTRAKAISERLERDFARATTEHLAALQEQLASVEAEQLQIARRAEALTRAERHAMDLRRARSTRTSATTARMQLERQLTSARATLAEERSAASAFGEQRSALEDKLGALPVTDDRSNQLAKASAFATPLQQALGAVPKRGQEAQRAASRAARAEQDLAEADTAMPGLLAAATELAAAAEKASRVYERARRDHAAAHLRSQLEEGELCPVCQQPIADKPEVQPTAVDDAQLEYDRVVEAARQAELRRRDLESGIASLRKSAPDLDGARAMAHQRHDEALATLAQLQEELAETGVALPEPLDAAVLKANIDRELMTITKNERERTRITTQLTQLVESQRDRQTRIAAATARIDLLEPQCEQQLTAEQAARTSMQEITARLKESLEGNPSPTTPASADQPDEAAQLQRRVQTMRGDVASTSHRTGQLTQQVKQLIAAIENADEMRQEQENLTAASAVGRSLADLLKANNFQTFVQEEALHLLAADGSARLKTLSQGRYSLRYDSSDFAVIDHWNADRERSVKTLSGGETFLTSLALSLGLAERIATLAAGDRGTAPLECLFIDEGFGALDSEALEVAVQALEALQGGDRMVGVVTHLSELADRLPARLTVINQSGRAHVAVD